MKDFRDLRVWEHAHQLTLKIYRATGQFPREELYVLVTQMRRCSISIGANIAEGCGKKGNNEFHRFLGIASIGKRTRLRTITGKRPRLSEHTGVWLFI